MIRSEVHDYWQHNPQPAVEGALPIRGARPLTLGRNKPMLLETSSPKSKAIFAAASALDEIHRLWLTNPQPAALAFQPAVERLRRLHSDHFREAIGIPHWLDDLYIVVGETRSPDIIQRYDALIVNLDSAQGFETVFI